MSGRNYLKKLFTDKKYSNRNFAPVDSSCLRQQASSVDMDSLVKVIRKMQDEMEFLKQENYARKSETKSVADELYYAKQEIRQLQDQVYSLEGQLSSERAKNIQKPGSSSFEVSMNQNRCQKVDILSPDGNIDKMSEISSRSSLFVEEDRESCQGDNASVVSNGERIIITTDTASTKLSKTDSSSIRIFQTGNGNSVKLLGTKYVNLSTTSEGYNQKADRNFNIRTSRLSNNEMKSFTVSRNSILGTERNLEEEDLRINLQDVTISHEYQLFTIFHTEFNVSAFCNPSGLTLDITKTRSKDESRTETAEQRKAVVISCTDVLSKIPHRRTQKIILQKAAWYLSISSAGESGSLSAITYKSLASVHMHWNNILKQDQFVNQLWINRTRDPWFGRYKFGGIIRTKHNDSWTRGSVITSYGDSYYFLLNCMAIVEKLSPLTKTISTVADFFSRRGLTTLEISMLTDMLYCKQIDKFLLRSVKMRCIWIMDGMAAGTPIQPARKLENIYWPLQLSVTSDGRFLTVDKYMQLKVYKHVTDERRNCNIRCVFSRQLPAEITQPWFITERPNGNFLIFDRDENYFHTQTVEMSPSMKIINSFDSVVKLCQKIPPEYNDIGLPLYSSEPDPVKPMPNIAITDNHGANFLGRFSNNFVSSRCSPMPNLPEFEFSNKSAKYERQKGKTFFHMNSSPNSTISGNRKGIKEIVLCQKERKRENQNFWKAKLRPRPMNLSSATYIEICHKEVGDFFMSDGENKRVLLVSANLKKVKVILDEKNSCIDNPGKIVYNEVNKQLLVGSQNSKEVRIFDLEEFKM